MAVQEEPKEPYVSSVLPWIILHRIIQHEEDAFRSLCCQQQQQNQGEEGEFYVLELWNTNKKILVILSC